MMVVYRHAAVVPSRALRGENRRKVAYGVLARLLLLFLGVGSENLTVARCKGK